MKDFQNVVLEIAALARIQLKHFAFVRVQPDTDKKSERALRKLLQPADGRTQDRAVEFFRERFREIFFFIRLVQRGEFFRERFERGKLQQIAPIISCSSRRKEALTFF